MVRCSRGSDWRRIRRRRNGGPLSQNSISAVAIPFATSIVTVLGSPQAEPAQPRALIGGHLVATFIGLLIAKLFGPVPWAAAPAVGKEAATDAARAKLRRFANRAFRSGLLSRTVEMTAEPGPRRLARAERQRLLHLIPFYREIKLDRAPMPPPSALALTRLALEFRTPSICLPARDAVR